MNKFLLILVFLACSVVAFAQTEHIHSVRCGHDIITNAMESKFPGYKNAMEATFRRAKENVSTSRMDVYRIPVVVHVVWKEAEENISDELIFDQIDVLNEDFRALNADAGNLRAEFGVATDAMIEFELVAIERVETVETFGMEIDILANPPIAFSDSKLKNTANGGSSPYDPATHLNIWVCNIQPIPIIGGQILGLAYPPVNLSDYPDLNNFPAEGLPTEPDYNGIAIHYPAFGGRDRMIEITDLGIIPFEGRTTVHEVGHYLGLRHIWGEPLAQGDDSCSVGDGIEDTPNAAENSQASGCDATKNSCTDDMNDLPDMWENYMDYSVEACQVTFTQGQVDLMRGVLEGPRADLYQIGSVANEEVENLQRSIDIAPNPTTGLVSLSIGNQANEDYQIIVRDILGSQKMNTLVNNGNNQVELDFSGFSNGVYFVEIQRGNVRAAKKIVLAK